jgi:hypothetical protein
MGISRNVRPLFHTDDIENSNNYFMKRAWNSFTKNIVYPIDGYRE